MAGPTCRGWVLWVTAFCWCVCFTGNSQGQSDFCTRDAPHSVKGDGLAMVVRFQQTSQCTRTKEFHNITSMFQRVYGNLPNFILTQISGCENRSRDHNVSYTVYFNTTLPPLERSAIGARIIYLNRTDPIFICTSYNETFQLVGPVQVNVSGHMVIVTDNCSLATDRGSCQFGNCETQPSGPVCKCDYLHWGILCDKKGDMMLIFAPVIFCGAVVFASLVVLSSALCWRFKKLSQNKVSQGSQEPLGKPRKREEDAF